MGNQKSQIANHKWPDDPIARSPDPRHAPVREAIARCYAATNDGLAVPWSGHAARLLAQFLATNKSWGAEVLVCCVRDRFASDNINPAEDPVRWIRRLPNYARGPLNRWGKPKLAQGRGQDPIEEYWRSKRGQG